MTHDRVVCAFMDKDSLRQLYANSTDAEIRDALLEGERAYRPEAWRAIEDEAAKRGISLASVAAEDAAAVASDAEASRASAAASPTLIVRFDDDVAPLYPTWCMGCGSPHAEVQLSFWRWSRYSMPRRFTIPMCAVCARTFRAVERVDRWVAFGALVVMMAAYYLSTAVLDLGESSMATVVIAWGSAIAWIAVMATSRKNARSSPLAPGGRSDFHVDQPRPCDRLCGAQWRRRHATTFAEQLGRVDQTIYVIVRRNRLALPGQSGEGS